MNLAKFFNHDFNNGNFKSYNNNGKKIYFEDSNGNWWKREYDNNGNVIYFEDSTGFWFKQKYDNNNEEIYYENSDGYWYKYEYDNNGKEIYYENSDGIIRDNRPNKCQDLIYCINCKHYIYYVGNTECKIIIDTYKKHNYEKCTTINIYLNPKEANKNNDCKYFEPEIIPQEDTPNPYLLKRIINYFKGVV